MSESSTNEWEAGGNRPVLSVADGARKMVLELRAEEPDAGRLALWVEVLGSERGAYTYDLFFQAVADAAPSDVVQHDDDLAIVVPGSSVDRLRGATLDLADGELVLVNPNVPPLEPWERPDADLSGPLAQQVLDILQEEINPSIASHGGRADLVAVDEGVVYLRLSGGCQGCGMASVTLGQGIEVVLKEEIPEVVRVVDVTDHAQGSNPYFESAKK